MAEYDFDRAMRVYLGGDPESSGIQIGNRDERLFAEFGADAEAISAELYAVLDAFAKPAISDGMSHVELASWIATELPAASSACRQKIESHVIYRMEH